MHRYGYSLFSILLIVTHGNAEYKYVFEYSSDKTPKIID